MIDLMMRHQGCHGWSCGCNRVVLAKCISGRRCLWCGRDDGQWAKLECTVAIAAADSAWLSQWMARLVHVIAGRLRAAVYKRRCMPISVCTTDATIIVDFVAILSVSFISAWHCFYRMVVFGMKNQNHTQPCNDSAHVDYRKSVKRYIP